MSEVDEARDRVRDLRARLDQDLGALEARLPERRILEAQIKTYGGAALGGLAGLGAAALLLRQRGERKQEEKAARRQAEAIVRALPDTALHIERHTVTSRTGPFALIIAAAALGVAAWNLFNGTRRDSPDVFGPPS